MKKIFFIILVISISCLFASPYEGTDITSSTSLTLSSNLETIFMQGTATENTKHSLAVGYTLNDKTVNGETIIPIGDDYKLQLTESYNGDKAKATGSIYAFFRVASLDVFNVTLTWDPLGKGTDSSQTINLLINNKSSGSVFYTFNPSSGVMADDRVKLEFTTGEYVNKDYVGTYSTTVKMTITGV